MNHTWLRGMELLREHWVELVSGFMLSIAFSSTGLERLVWMGWEPGVLVLSPTSWSVANRTQGIR